MRGGEGGGGDGVSEVKIWTLLQARIATELLVRNTVDTYSLYYGLIVLLCTRDKGNRQQAR